MATLSLANALQAVAREDLPVGIRDMLPEVSNLFREVKTTWEGVESGLGKSGRAVSTGNFISAGWVKRWTVCSGGGGAFWGVDPNPQLLTEFGANHSMWANTTVAPGPQASDFVMPTYANPYVALKEGMGVLAMPWNLLRANKISNVVADVVGDIVTKAAQMTALSEAICFFSRNPSWGEVARTNWYVDDGAVHAHPGVTQLNMAGAGTHVYLTISTWGAEDNPAKFRPGMSVDIMEVWNDVSADTAAGLSYVTFMDAAGWIVDAVDYVNKKVTFVTKSGAVASRDPRTTAAGDTVAYIITLQNFANLVGATTHPIVDITLALGAGHWHDLYGTGTAITEAAMNAAFDVFILTDATVPAAYVWTTYGFDGLNDFVKTAATQSFYGISCGAMPNLLSLYVANVGDYLTERYWNSVMGWFRQQYGERFMPDTIVTTYGVLNGALQTAFRFEDNTAVLTTAPMIQQFANRDSGKPSPLHMDYAGVTMGHRGHRFKVYDDVMCPKTNLYGIKTADDNYQRLVPPPVPGAGSHAEFSQEIQFLGQITDRGIWSFARNTDGRRTRYLEAPYVLTCNHYVRDPQAIRLRGITEAIGV